MRDGAAAEAPGGGCCGQALVRLLQLPARVPRHPQAALPPAPDGRAARGSARWRGRPGRAPWPAARTPGAALGLPFAHSRLAGAASEPPHREPTSEAKQKRRT